MYTTLAVATKGARGEFGRKAWYRLVQCTASRPVLWSDRQTSRLILVSKWASMELAVHDKTPRSRALQRAVCMICVCRMLDDVDCPRMHARHEWSKTSARNMHFELNAGRWRCINMLLPTTGASPTHHTRLQSAQQHKASYCPFKAPTSTLRARTNPRNPSDHEPTSMRSD